MLILKGILSFINFPLKMSFANKPMPHYPRTHYSTIPTAERSGAKFISFDKHSVEYTLNDLFLQKFKMLWLPKELGHICGNGIKQGCEFMSALISDHLLVVLPERAEVPLPKNLSKPCLE